jgi:hypothetical protein
MKTPPKRHAGSPLVTNAACNRDVAYLAHKAGLTIWQIARAWPEVWRVVLEAGRPVLSQRYDYCLMDGSDRWETDRRITRASLAEAIRAHRAAAAAAGGDL